MNSLLVIEDDSNYREMLLAILSNMFVMDFASTLQDGLRKLVASEPDAVLLDMDLPDSPKDETLARVKACRDRSALVALSGHTDPEFVRKTICDTADGFVKKGEDDKDVGELAWQIRQAIASRLKCRMLEQSAKRLEGA